MRTEKADIMSSCNLETKTDTKTRMRYTREAESRSTKSSHKGLATGFGWRLSKLSGKLHPKVPRGDCTILAFGPWAHHSQGELQGEGKSGKWLPKVTSGACWVWCLALPCRLSHTRGIWHGCQAPEKKEKHPIFVFITITQIQRRECLQISLWLAVFRPFNFLLLNMNNETEQFLVLQCQPSPA